MRSVGCLDAGGLVWANLARVTLQVLRWEGGQECLQSHSLHLSLADNSGHGDGVLHLQRK